MSVDAWQSCDAVWLTLQINGSKILHFNKLSNAYLIESILLNFCSIFYNFKHLISLSRYLFFYTCSQVKKKLIKLHTDSKSIKEEVEAHVVSKCGWILKNR